MDDRELLRYSRHILLDELGIEGQQRLCDARALLIGVGGLGSAAAGYLCASGLGGLTLVDDDAVDLTNLQRQLLHGTPDIGRPKIESARASLRDLNPLVSIETSGRHADEELVADLANDADIVLDCCDNFDTRYAVNAACVRTATPLVSGSAIRWSGQVAVLPLTGGKGPCYACVYPPDTRAAEERCSETGVLAPLVGIIGSLQATQAILLLIGQHEDPVLHRFDALRQEFSHARLKRDTACAVCT